MKKRFGIPLFFERSIIEIRPVRVEYWPGGDTTVAPQVFELEGGEMTALAPVEAVTRAEGFDHAIVSFVGGDGYPTSVAGDFTCEPHAATITVGPIDPASLPADGTEVCLTVSHIRPQPGIGYDERRYVNLWGPAHVDGRILSVTVTQASGWDEADVPFFEYAERSVPVAHDYFADVGGRPQLSRGWKFFLATRLPFLTATIVPIALGGAVAGYDGKFALGWWLLALVAGCLVHLGLNIANDLFDDASGADAANTTPTPFSGGSRVMQYGLVEPEGHGHGVCRLLRRRGRARHLPRGDAWLGAPRARRRRRRALDRVHRTAVPARAPRAGRTGHRGRLRTDHDPRRLLRLRRSSGVARRSTRRCRSRS